MNTDGVSLPTKGELCDLRIPPSGGFPEIVLNMTPLIEARNKVAMAKTINPSIYYELERVYGEGYRQGKSNLGIVNYEITKVEKRIREVKSGIILDDYPDFLSSGKLKDSAAVRDAFVERNPEYSVLCDRLNLLKATAELLEGSYIKHFENVSRYIKVEMNLILRSGVDTNKYTSR